MAKSLDSVVVFQLPVGLLRVTLEAALSAAAGVHMVRDEAKVVTVTSHPVMTQLGLYAHERGGRPVAIVVNEQATDPRLTLLHEFGHYLDQHAIESAGYASVASELDTWRHVVLQSQGVADLIGHWVSPPAVAGDPARAAMIADAVRAHVEYLLGPRELFARSYCQYVAVRSGDVELLKELEIARQANYREQWHDDDFSPIAAALDDVFDQLGWR